MSVGSPSVAPLRGAVAVADRDLGAVGGYLMLAIILALIALAGWLAYTNLGHAGVAPVWIDPERKAAMISNLLVVLVGDREATPVINTGTLYS